MFTSYSLSLIKSIMWTRLERQEALEFTTQVLQANLAT